MYCYLQFGGSSEALYIGMKLGITQNYKNETQTFKSRYFKSKAFPDL